MTLEEAMECCARREQQIHDEEKRERDELMAATSRLLDPERPRLRANG